MHTFEYRFYPKDFEEDFINEYDSDRNWYISSLVKNGLVLEEWQNTVKYESYYACRLIAPEIDSLDLKYYNKYNHQFLETLIEKSVKPPEYEYIGENYDDVDCCECEHSSHYVLYTAYNSSGSPIICGECLSPVPLYKFPKTYDDSEYYDILNWQKVYRACDTQFMQGVGERHGYYMIHNPKSELARDGFRICRSLEMKTEKPFYYFLYDYYGKNKPVCPVCGEQWVNQYLDTYTYDYVCQACRLVSNKTKTGIKRVAD